MWSKQAASRNKQVNLGNTTKTSNAKSHRKRKNDKKHTDSNSTTILPQPAASTKKNASKQTSNKAKGGKHLDNGGVDVCDSKAPLVHGPDLIEDIKASCKLNEIKATKDVVAICPTPVITQYDDGATADVVLRKKNDDANQSSQDAQKRYSDSIVNDNFVNGIHESDNKFVLSRTHSGFFLLNSSKDPETKEKKRRFSDLFRHSLGKSASEDKDSKMPGFGINEDGNVVPLLDTVDKKDSKKAVKRADTKLQKPKNNKCVENKNPNDVSTTSNSYLKRVRSRIYKSKAENSVSVVPSMPDISEQKEKKNSKNVNTPDKKSFDFRLRRQSSNLECTRPKTILVTPMSTPLVDKPIKPLPEEKLLAKSQKSKSSSAINLSMLRTRRKLLDGKKHSNPTKQAEVEFDFFTFDNNYRNKNVSLLNRAFGSHDFINNLNNNVENGCGNHSVRRTSWFPLPVSESKPGNPVTRTPSDRRPDAVREESRNQDTHGHLHDNDNDHANTESTVSLPASTTGNKQRQNNHINRSESVKEHSEKNRKQKRNISDPLHNGDPSMFIDSTSAFSQQSGSSSNSSNSISSRSVDDSPINEKDSDLDDDDHSGWKSTLNEEQLSKLHPTEKAKQNVINELFFTEKSHVRNLKVLDIVFRRQIVDKKAITESEQHLVFANLPEILSIHNQFKVAMKKKGAEDQVTDISDLLLEMFDGDLGNRFCIAVSKFCEKQQLALELISEKRKKDSKFESFLQTCERHELCRRLPLQGLLPQEMQRTTKYKLLVERLIDIQEDLIRMNPSDAAANELKKLKMALEKLKVILNSVNEAATLAHNEYRLDEIRSHLDIITSSVWSDKTIVWTLVREGQVQLKRQNKTIPVHMLLLKEAVILLHKEGDRFLLKCFHVNNQPQSPIIKISNLICRHNAADTTGLFLLSNAVQNSQMYEIQCPDEADRKTWLKYLTDASEPYKSRESKNKKVERNLDPEEEELPATKPDVLERAEPISENDIATGSSSSQRNSNALEEDAIDKTSSTPDNEVPSVHTAGEGGTVMLTANDWPLIEPSEVQVAETSVHTAEPILTPLEKIKRKDEEVKKALADKEVLVADLLSIPRENYRVIADMVSEKRTDVEPYELVLASVHQVNELISAVNDSMNITEADAVTASGGKHPSCNSNEPSLKQNHVPSVPVSKIQSIATTLMSQLTTLLSSVKQRDEDSEKMRKEVHRLREQLHEKCDVHPSQSTNHHDSDIPVYHESTQSGDLESIEESPSETETT